MTDTNILYSFHFPLHIFRSLCYCVVHVYIVNKKNVNWLDGNIFGVFRVKNHDFTPKNHFFSNFRGCTRPPPGSASNMYRIFIVFLSPITVLNCRSNYQEAKGWDAIYWIQPRHNFVYVPSQDLDFQ